MRVQYITQQSIEHVEKCGIPERRSPRLRGFNYSDPGEYFVTVCTADRACILGAVANGAMTLSIVGRIVEDCWLAIPEHFPHTRAGVYQIMPNHVHGIIEITKAHRKPRPCRPYV